MRFKIKYYIVALVLPFLISSCTMVTYQPKQEVPKTQLQVREYQTRMFDTNNVKLVMKAALNVLQDDGFVVKNAVVDLGLLSASKEIDLSKSSKTGSSDDTWGAIFAALANSKHNNNNNRKENTFQKVKIIEVSVNVSEYGNQCKVRANFQAKILDNTGNTVEVFEVEDMKFYQDFFLKMDKGIFIQKQGL